MPLGPSWNKEGRDICCADAPHQFAELDGAGDVYIDPIRRIGQGGTSEERPIHSGQHSGR
jgi:hypothetical protein